MLPLCFTWCTTVIYPIQFKSGKGLNNLRQHGSRSFRTPAPRTNASSRDTAAGRGCVGLPAAAVAVAGTSLCVQASVLQSGHGRLGSLAVFRCIFAEAD